MGYTLFNVAEWPTGKNLTTFMLPFVVHVITVLRMGHRLLKHHLLCYRLPWSVTLHFVNFLRWGINIIILSVHLTIKHNMQFYTHNLALIWGVPASCDSAESHCLIAVGSVRPGRCTCTRVARVAVVGEPSERWPVSSVLSRRKLPRENFHRSKGSVSLSLSSHAEPVVRVAPAGSAKVLKKSKGCYMKPTICWRRQARPGRHQFYEHNIPDP